MARANYNAQEVSVKTTYCLTPAQLTANRSDDFISHVQTYNHDDKALHRGVLDGSIPSVAANSSATSSVGTIRDSKHFISTRKQSNKIFCKPNGATEFSIFDRDKVNIDDQRDTVIAVSWAAILQG